MPRLPRDVSGPELAIKLKKLGYVVVRRSGSHMRLDCELASGTHHITIPSHNPLKIGTLNGILVDIASSRGMKKDQLLEQLFDELAE
jgi:predicted RNA binding protein YcfA (HicA-like mRNA interferase family)